MFFISEIQIWRNVWKENHVLQRNSRVLTPNKLARKLEEGQLPHCKTVDKSGFNQPSPMDLWSILKSYSFFPSQYVLDSLFLSFNIITLQYKNNFLHAQTFLHMDLLNLEDSMMIKNSIQKMQHSEEQLWWGRN